MKKDECKTEIKSDKKWKIFFYPILHGVLNVDLTWGVGVQLPPT